MHREQVLQQQGEWLEQQLWELPCAQPRALKRCLRARLKRRGLTLREVFAEVSDEALVLAIQKGFFAADAFEELLENRYKRRLFGWVNRYRISFHDAQDLVHTILLKLWSTRFDSYQPRAGKHANFRAYLRRIAQNRSVQEWRKRRRMKSGGMDEAPEPSANGHSPQQPLESTEFAERVERALSQLPLLDQQVMRATLEEQTLPEIAQALGLSYAAVAIRLYRARNKLEQALALPPRRQSARGR